MQNEPDHVPEAVYGCANTGCAEDGANAPGGMYWQDGIWVCEFHAPVDPANRGITLADYLKRRDTPADYDGLPVEMAEGDPINAAYREAIKAEDVPEWAVWVATDANGEVHDYGSRPYIGEMWDEWLVRGDGKCEDLAAFDAIRMKSIDWTQTLRRVDAVWPQLKKGGA